MSERPIRLVLDTSAVIANGRGSIHVGEVLAEIADEHGVAVVPLPCLVEAVGAVSSDAHLTVLAEHEATEVLADDGATWRDLAALRDIVGRHDSASAALAAIDFDVDILTRTPLLYAGVAGGSLVIPIDE